MPSQFGNLVPFSVPLHLRHALIFVICALLVRTPAPGCGGWFEEAPPLLPHYLGRLPAKSFGEIFLETTPPPKDTPEPDFTVALMTLNNRMTQTDRPKLIAEVDGLLAAAREHYENGDWCNLLHDVRDVLSSRATNADAADYIQWRIGNADDFFILKEKKDSFEYPPKKPDITKTKLAKDLEARAASAPDSLRPHWLYLRGALGFRAGDRTECQAWFDRVVRDYPDHPRAEIALFMSARCAYGLTAIEEPVTVLNQDYQKAAAEEKVRHKKKRAEARALFEAYLKKYPQGRFVADACGWLGDLVDDRTTALDYFIRQVEAPGHPEVRKSALFMCERILSDAAAEDEGTFALAAAHPTIAMGLTYLVMNSPHAPEETEDHPPVDEIVSAQNESARAKKWRQQVLPRLAAQVAARKDAYQSDAWEPRYLAILAQAASAAGNSEQALKLTEMSPARNDDLLFARGVTLQRAGRPREAVTSYRALSEKFPRSPLAKGARLRAALALEDDHHAGLAIVELQGMLPKEDAQEFDSDPIYPPPDSELELTASIRIRDISGAEIEQIRQLIDTLYNFAPTSEIAEITTAPHIEDAIRADARAILAQRHLGKEEFREAKKYMSPAQYALLAAGLEKKTAAADTAGDPRAKAAAMQALGDAWAAARGKLLRLPLDSQKTTSAVFNSDYDEAGLRRRENGKALGLKDVDGTLEDRDELRHASRWWMRAARALPGSPLAAAARWKALEAMPKLAIASGFASQLAVETDAAAVSRELYDRLRSEAPDSIEARQYAVYWSFPKLLDRWTLGFEPVRMENREAGGRGYRYGDFRVYGVAVPEEWMAQQDRDGWRKLGQGIAALRADAAKTPLPETAAKAEALAKNARELFKTEYDAYILNFFDDIVAFLREPGVTPSMAETYVDLRIRFITGESRMPAIDSPSNVDAPTDADISADPYAPFHRRIARALALPEMMPVADYLEFLDAALVASDWIQVDVEKVFEEKDGEKEPVTYPSRDYPKIEKLMRAFLAKYPASHKREAAALVLARAVFMQSRPYYYFPRSFDTPEPIAHQREAFNPKRVLAPLEAYDREFPQGRYAAEIRNFRAYTAWRMGDWGKALDLTLPQLSDTTKPDLQPEASLRLANIFADLADAKKRSGLIEAIRARPEAIKRLAEDLQPAPAHRSHPLRFLETYLSDQLGLKVVHKAAGE